MKNRIEHKGEILPNLFCLEGTPGYGYRSFCYVIAYDHFSVLIDVNDERFLTELAEYPPPKHLILTHRHSRLHEAKFEKKFGLSVWLHPEDAQAPRKGPAAGTEQASKYENPLAGGLEDLGFQFFHVPGHTPGCCFALLQHHGGILFVGDAVVGPKDTEVPHLSKPPAPTSDNDPELQASLRKFIPPPHTGIFPFHGEPVIAPSVEITQELWKKLRATL